jgi:hypothetical protein
MALLKVCYLASNQEAVAAGAQSFGKGCGPRSKTLSPFQGRARKRHPKLRSYSREDPVRTPHNIQSNQLQALQAEVRQLTALVHELGAQRIVQNEQTAGQGKKREGGGGLANANAWAGCRAEIDDIDAEIEKQKKATQVLS